MSTFAIVEAFADLPDPRRTAGQRHAQALCLALFTLAVAAGHRGFFGNRRLVERRPSQIVEPWSAVALVKVAHLPLLHEGLGLGS